MKASELYKELKSQAKEVTDIQNTILYVSDMVSEYIRKQVKAMASKQVDEILLDKELGIINEEIADKEIQVEVLIYKSL